MTQDRTAGTPAPGPRPGEDESDDLTERITAALRSRAPGDDDTAATVRRIADRLAAAGDRNGAGTRHRRVGAVAVTGVVASALGVVGAGAAAAADPYTPFAVVVDGIAQAVGVEWSSMPDGYTREQHDAFWGAAYTAADLQELRELWHVDAFEAKARAGQMILDGESLPVVPDGTGAADTSAPYLDQAEERAYREAGYTFEDAERLAELWHVDAYEAKARAAEMLLDGETPPLP
ncbi:hypothetical protein [Promicromonospora sp. NPDC019610]|uniref:hypothetical protein n=1 Tax=Promicromonospora sp. NPDC019610 TaxID=3364405 RepID=UPI00378E16EB